MKERLKGNYRVTTVGAPDLFRRSMVDKNNFQAKCGENSQWTYLENSTLCSILDFNDSPASIIHGITQVGYRQTVYKVLLYISTSYNFHYATR